MITPSLAFSSASADGGAAAKKSVEGIGSISHLDELPESKHPAMHDLLDRARARLAEKNERDDLKKRILKKEADRKKRIEASLEKFLGKDLPDYTPDSHKPGILKSDVKVSKSASGPREPNQSFVPISTKEIKSAFSKVMKKTDVNLHRDGNDLIVDVLCSKSNEGPLQSALPVGKATAEHIDDIRDRYCDG